MGGYRDSRGSRGNGRSFRVSPAAGPPGGGGGRPCPTSAGGTAGVGGAAGAGAMLGGAGGAVPALRASRAVKLASTARAIDCSRAPSATARGG